MGWDDVARLNEVQHHIYDEFEEREREREQEREVGCKFAAALSWCNRFQQNWRVDFGYQRKEREDEKIGDVNYSLQTLFLDAQ